MTNFFPELTSYVFLVKDRGAFVLSLRTQKESNHYDSVFSKKGHFQFDLKSSQFILVCQKFHMKSHEFVCFEIYVALTSYGISTRTCIC